MLSFGLVSVPVELFTGDCGTQAGVPPFEQGLTESVRGSAHADEAEGSDVVKGVTGGGDYVVLDQDELDSIAPAGPG